MQIADYITGVLRKTGNGYLRLQSAYGDLEQALDIVIKEPIVHAIEIGNYQGLSTAVLAKYAKRVFTFDVCTRNQEYNWNILGVRDKINMFIGPQELIDYEINYYFKIEWPKGNVKTNFNFAFIDGDHTYEGIKHDFKMLKFTKRILFHDYAIGPYVLNFCNEIGAKQVGELNFAYWEAGDK
jgi:hypothetical protein